MIDFFGDFKKLGFGESVTLVKQNGGRTPNVEVLIEDTEFTVEDTSLLIESGDYFERTLPNGQVVTFEVIFVDMQRGGVDFPDIYEIKTRRCSDINTNKRQQQTVINNYGQFNVATENASINATQNNGISSGELDKIIEQIKGEFLALNADDKKSAVESIEVIEAEAASKKPRKSMIKTALSALQAIKGTAEFGAAVAVLAQFFQTWVG